MSHQSSAAALCKRATAHRAALSESQCALVRNDTVFRHIETLPTTVGRVYASSHWVSSWEGVT